MKLQHIKIRKADLDRVPAEERTLLVLLAHAANELNILAKLFRWTATPVDVSAIEERGSITVSLAIVRLLAGKLHEMWKLLEKGFFGTRLSMSYEPALDGSEQAALQKLKRYFGKANIIEKVRNGYSFHYAPDQVTAAYAAMPEEEEELERWRTATDTKCGVPDDDKCKR